MKEGLENSTLTIEEGRSRGIVSDQLSEFRWMDGRAEKKSQTRQKFVESHGPLRLEGTRTVKYVKFHNPLVS